MYPGLYLNDFGAGQMEPERTQHSPEPLEQMDNYQFNRMGRSADTSDDDFERQLSMMRGIEEYCRTIVPTLRNAVAEGTKQSRPSLSAVFGCRALSLSTSEGFEIENLRLTEKMARNINCTHHIPSLFAVLACRAISLNTSEGNEMENLRLT